MFSSFLLILLCTSNGCLFVKISMTLLLTFSVCLLFCLSPFSGQDSASQFLLPGILIAVGMLLLLTFIFVAAYCIR